MEYMPDKPPLWVDGSPAGVSFGSTEPMSARFTVLAGDVGGLLHKLEYELEQFSRAHHSNPPDITGIVFNCLNFIVTAQSLYDWFKAEMRDPNPDQFDQVAFDAVIQERLPYQGLCRDVANTLKHRRFRDGLWPGGAVRLEYIPTEASGLAPLAILIFEQPQGMSMDALGLLTLIAGQWRKLLSDYMPVSAAAPPDK